VVPCSTLVAAAGQGWQSSDEMVSGGKGLSSAVRDGGTPYKIMLSATREVCQGVLPRHL
jgi:hypothetical protein